MLTITLGNQTGEHVRRSLLARCGLAGALITTALAVPYAPAMASTGPVVLYQENFTGGDTPAGDWISKSTGGNSRPCLTAAAAAATGGIPECQAVAGGTGKPDPAGSGAFQITDNDKQESGFGLFTRPLDTSKGIEVDFDFFQHDAHTYNGRGGDGIAFFLMNGAASPATAGDAGGSLGYRNLPGGLIGIGFDEYGNFSNPQWGGTGGPGLTPNSVVLRGADSTGYQYIAGVKAPASRAAARAPPRGARAAPPPRAGRRKEARHDHAQHQERAQRLGQLLQRQGAGPRSRPHQPEHDQGTAATAADDQVRVGGGHPSRHAL